MGQRKHPVFKGRAKISRGVLFPRATHYQIEDHLLKSDYSARKNESLKLADI
jgi:hypothetical protein